MKARCAVRSWGLRYPKDDKRRSLAVLRAAKNPFALTACPKAAYVHGHRHGQERVCPGEPQQTFGSALIVHFHGQHSSLTTRSAQLREVEVPLAAW
jgi:hypothetical protein